MQFSIYKLLSMLESTYCTSCSGFDTCQFMDQHYIQRLVKLLYQQRDVEVKRLIQACDVITRVLSHLRLITLSNHACVY